jgi:hypothetical protein
MLLFMSVFGFIGVTVLIFLWTARGFGAPPLVFRVFGSFIALGFIFMGFGLPLTVLLKGRGGGNGFNAFDNLRPPEAKPGRPPGSYDCPNCGANVGDADVSPSGDIKCSYCDEWWNIHSR